MRSGRDEGLPTTSDSTDKTARAAPQVKYGSTAVADIAPCLPHPGASYIAELPRGRRACFLVHWPAIAFNSVSEALSGTGTKLRRELQIYPAMPPFSSSVA
ncbi:hypothetical protein GCM10010360_65810 [Streptomyces nogalater]